MNRLTETQKKQITRELKKADIEQGKLDAFFALIDRHLLSAKWDDLYGNYTPAEKMFDEHGPLSQFYEAIHKLQKDPDTMLALDAGYTMAYPCPEWENENDAISNQKKKTALVRPTAEGFEIVHIGELMERVKNAAANIQTRTQGDRGRWREMEFVKGVASIYEATTGQTANQGEMFRSVVEILLEPFNTQAADVTSLIRRTLKSYNRNTIRDHIIDELKK